MGLHGSVLQPQHADARQGEVPLQGKQRQISACQTCLQDVAPLALLLWAYHLPEVRTIVRIVHTEPRISSLMRLYGDKLERTGALVEWIPAGNMDCVTKSQLVRYMSSLLLSLDI